MLNAASASRLFYPNYLPGFKQDSEEWAYVYDPNSYIAHEGLKEEGPGGWSPYATGDAISGGWGETNLSLYSSSHVGILGGIIETTNIEGILQLDLLKTDYFHQDAYPTYLYFNPHNEDELINIDLPTGVYDIYETITNQFLQNGVNGSAQINVASNEAVVIVLVPSGGVVTEHLNKKIVNNIVIDFDSGIQVSDYPPRVKSIGFGGTIVRNNSLVELYCTAYDKENNITGYNWKVTGGTINGEGDNVSWNTPISEGEYNITVEVSDEGGNTASYTVNTYVQETVNNFPVIEDLTALPRKVDLGNITKVNCIASDADNDQLTYEWTAADGSINGYGSIIQWTAPNISGNYYIFCEVSDGKGGFARDSILMSVRDLSVSATGNLICFYPFNQNGHDESGNNNNGVIDGATFFYDRFNNLNSALRFDGLDDNMIVKNSTSLNFTDAITINFWMIIDEFYAREQYPLSHGNWERRWKVSISNNRLRWTIKTSNGIVDLDSETELTVDSLYNFTVTYSGSEMEIYINGNLDSFKDWSGELAASNLDMSIGQSIPGDNNYNFDGILDDIRIYDYAISLETIINLYDISTNIKEADNMINETRLYQNYPNPFNNQTKISYELAANSFVKLDVFNSLGERVKSLVDEEQLKGKYDIHWNGEDDNGSKVATGIYFLKINSGNYNIARKILLLK